jgi:hypothetical protein
MMEGEATRALKLADRIKPLLAGKGPGVQSAALADLVALWLAGHIDVTGALETDFLREPVLENWLKTVRELVPACEADILRTKQRPQKRPQK